MKKSTVLALIVIFFVSVFLVGVYGVHARSPEIIYVEEIKISSVETNETTLTVGISQDGSRYVMLPFTEGLTLIVVTSVTPAESTNPSVKMSLIGESEEEPAAVIGERGEILILLPGSVHLQFRAQDRPTAAVMDFWIHTY